MEFFEAYKITTSRSTYGYITLKSFYPEIPSSFSGRVFEFYSYLAEQLFKTLQNMSNDAVAVVVSNNEGGLFYLAKRTFEFLTDKNEPPIPFVSRAINIILSMYTLHSNEDDDLLLPAVEQCFQIGEQFPWHLAHLFNYTNFYNGDISVPKAKQAVKGILILVSNAHPYSASDYLASWVKDTDAELVVRLDKATGGGGATVERLSYLHFFYRKFFGQSFHLVCSFL